MALPPAANISTPAAEASGWLLTTMPRLAVAGRRSQVKTVPVRSRQLLLIVTNSLTFAPVVVRI
jgi:hypothetical protein